MWIIKQVASIYLGVVDGSWSNQDALAEAEGFEPSCPCEPKVFETWPFSHSGTLPDDPYHTSFSSDSDLLCTGQRVECLSSPLGLWKARSNEPRYAQGARQPLSHQGA